MVLENKLNITDSRELARMEEKISKKKAVKLLEAVTENPYNLFYYAQFLVMDYPNEIYELCANYIREQCAQATDRRLYKKVCKDLLQLIKWKGNATAKLLVDEFKATYPRRSALLDELQKVERKL